MTDEPEPGPLPTGALDIWVVTLIAVGGAAMVMGNIVILWNRTYRPIKSKSVPLTLLSSLGGLFWIIAVLVTNDHFKRKKRLGLNFCILWTYWLQVCGFAIWLNCLTLRLIVLYRIFICKKEARTYYPFLALLLLPAVVFCIVASFLGQLKERYSAGSLKMEAQLRDVRAEVEKYKQKIRQLEEEVEALEIGCAAMQLTTSPHVSPNAHESITKNSC